VEGDAGEGGAAGGDHAEGRDLQGEGGAGGAVGLVGVGVDADGERPALQRVDGAAAGVGDGLDDVGPALLAGRELAGDGVAVGVLGDGLEVDRVAGQQPDLVAGLAAGDVPLQREGGRLVEGVQLGDLDGGGGVVEARDVGLGGDGEGEVAGGARQRDGGGAAVGGGGEDRGLGVGSRGPSRVKDQSMPSGVPKRTSTAKVRVAFSSASRASGAEGSVRQPSVQLRAILTCSAPEVSSTLT
jgi:hypothetical protein